MIKKSSAIKAVSKLNLFAVTLIFLFFAGVSAQKSEHYNSPLYAPKTYDPSQTASNGLPPVLKKVGIDQNLGAQVPLDAEFKNENGETVKLGSYFGNKRPVILAMVYYECPMLCNEVLNGLTGSLKGISFDAGKDFDVVAISFDTRENEKPDLAKNKKASYVARYGHAGAENGWHFLTGEQSEIDKVAQAVGFNYYWDARSEQFAHAGGIMILTPDGKVSRYFYGIDYAPGDLKLGIIDSGEGKIGNAVERLYLYCYHYDPATGTYGLQVLRVMRLAAVATLLTIAGMLFVFWRYKRTNN